MGRVLVVLLLLVPTAALADITGVARVIDGDTIEVQGQRIHIPGSDSARFTKILPSFLAAAMAS